MRFIMTEYNISNLGLIIFSLTFHTTLIQNDGLLFNWSSTIERSEVSGDITKI